MGGKNKGIEVEDVCLRVSLRLYSRYLEAQPDNRATRGRSQGRITTDQSEKKNRFVMAKKSANPADAYRESRITLGFQG